MSGGTTMETVRIRAGDAERETTAATLRDAHAEGRLSMDEFGSRIDATLAATYLDELPPLVADLPVNRTPTPQGKHRSWSPLVLAIGALALLLMVTGHPPFPLLSLALFLFWRRAFRHDRPAGRLTARAAVGPARTA